MQKAKPPAVPWCHPPVGKDIKPFESIITECMEETSTTSNQRSIITQPSPNQYSIIAQSTRNQRSASTRSALNQLASISEPQLPRKPNPSLGVKRYAQNHTRKPVMSTSTVTQSTSTVSQPSQVKHSGRQTTHSQLIHTVRQAHNQSSPNTAHSTPYTSNIHKQHSGHASHHTLHNHPSTPHTPSLIHKKQQRTAHSSDSKPLR